MTPPVRMCIASTAIVPARSVVPFVLHPLERSFEHLRAEDRWGCRGPLPLVGGPEDPGPQMDAYGAVGNASSNAARMSGVASAV